MKQILQNLKSGKLGIDEVPAPVLSGPGVLVATQASVISAGTEKLMMEFAGKSLIGKAIARPDQVKQVMDKIKRDGLKATIETVFARLDQPMPLGYSSAGIVLATSPEVTEIKPGDRVACGGAPHAEVVFVSRNLVVPVPGNVDFDSASFTTLGAIALQGVRVAELVVGEKVVVLGLGLLGLITVQLAKAAGCCVIGTDINPERLALAQRLGCDYVCQPEKLRDIVADVSRNIGTDAVIITAATKSNEPVELAAEVVRKKGRISVIGSVGMDIPRRPFYYKELELRLSMSYGPGRYDPQYEEKGIDYPQAYVPWTEQRNMACVVDLMGRGKLDVKSLITHRYPIEQAEEAYKLVRGESKEPYLGIVLTYPSVDHCKAVPSVTREAVPLSRKSKDKVGVGIIGAGLFTQGTILPALSKISGFELVAIASQKGCTAAHAAGKFKIGRSVSDYRDILASEAIDVVFITTRHNKHASLVTEALQAGKHIFVEKPLCITEVELQQIVQALNNRADRMVMVGFNRRFAPMGVELKGKFNDKGPLSINYICNAGFVPKDNWSQDPQVGGGRIIGEACHFIDWMIWLTGAMPTKVYAQSIGRETAKALKEDNVMISLSFDDGSIGTVSYLACGDKSFTKEHIQVFGGGCIGVLEDFRRGSFTQNGSTSKLKNPAGKGHLQQWQGLCDAIKYGKNCPLPFEQSVCSTWTTLKAMESLHTGLAVEI